MVSESKNSIVRLACSPNNYPWGKIGKSSLVAQFAANACKPDTKVDESEPYSELWMGSHPTSPSQVYPSGPLLSEYLANHPEQLGEAKKFRTPFTGKGEKEAGGGHLPFLFKILCCKQALPLQIHPNTDLAAELHQKDPDQFPDTNHKPEIAVCLSDRFLGFAHFRPLPEIASLIRAIPELREVPAHLQVKLSAFTSGGVQADESALKNAWITFLGDGSEKELGGLVSKFAKRVEKEGVHAWAGLGGDVWSENVRKNLTEAVGLLEKYYPGDPSTFAVLIFMNLIELKKGEGMYVGADGLHAWLQGDIVELMAISDNVLNVGFTDRSEINSHLPIVAETMTFHSVDPSTIALERTPFVKGKKQATTVYSVPFEEFSILHIEGEEELEALSGPAIGIVTSEEAVTVTASGSGEGTTYERGSVFFVPANTGFRTEGKGEVWMAFYDGDGKTSEQVGAQ